MGLLAYFFLEKLGWRSFTLITSLPLFIICIVLLQFFLVEENRTGDPWYQKQHQGASLDEGNSEDNQIANEEPSIWTAEYWHEFKVILPKFIKILIISAVTEYLGMGLSVLLPNMVRSYNSRFSINASKCSTRMFGEQFLVYSLVMGFTNLLAKAVGYYLYKVMATRYIIWGCSVIFTVSYGLLIFFKDILVVVDILSGIIRFIYSLNALIMMLVTYNPEVFGKNTLLLASSLLIGSENIATVLSIVFDESFVDTVVVIICLVLSLAQLAASSCLREV